MPNPIPPYDITTPYGTPGHWAAGYHTGDDYSTRGRVGVPVLAAHRGWVLSSSGLWGSAYGTHVVVLARSLGIQMGYCHLSSAVARAGRYVRAGDLIGYSGNTGRSTGPHLHYEERVAPFLYRSSRRPRFNRRSR